MNTKHGVLYRLSASEPAMLLTIANNRWHTETLAETPHSLTDMCELAEQYRLTHLWVHPAYGEHPNQEFYDQAVPVWELLGSWSEFEEENLLVSVTGCRSPRGGQHWFSIVFPINSQWTWADEDLTPKLNLQVVKYMEEALSVSIGGGPTTAGMKLLQQVHVHHPEKLKKPDVDMAALPFDGSAKTLVWSRKLKPGEEKKRYIHKVDKNSDFLRSCVEQYVGAGTPVHVFTSQGIDEKLPGVWRITVEGTPAFDGVPMLWNDAEWVSTPIVKMLRQFGHNVDIHEGWQFPTKFKILDTWAKLLWESRVAFRSDADRWKQRQAAEMAGDGIKDIATSTVGLFNSTDDGVQKTWKYRPDWNAQIIGSSRALMFYNMKKYGVPLMVYIDAMFYVSDEEDVEKAIPGILDYKDSLGGYKHVWTLPIDQAVLDILAMLPGDENIAIGLLNDMAGE